MARPTFDEVANQSEQVLLAMLVSQQESDGTTITVDEGGTVDQGTAGAEPWPVEQAQLRRTQDAVSAAPVTGVVMQGDTERTPVFLAIDAASSGNNTLLAAQGSGNKIRVHQLFLVASAAVTVRFESGADGTALTGQMQFAANGGIVLPFSPVAWFETAANTLLNLELSGAVSVDGGLVYTVVS